MVFAYYQYLLEEDTHALDIDRFLKKSNDTENNSLYAVTAAGYQYPDSLSYLQQGVQALVVADHILYSNTLYGLEHKDNADKLKRIDVAMLLTYSMHRQNVKGLSG